jgi:hypothetical protein
MSLQLAFPIPPVYEDEIRVAAFMDSEKAHSVSVIVIAGRRQAVRRDALGCRDQCGWGPLVVSRDSVHLQPPSPMLPQLQKEYGKRTERFGQMDWLAFWGFGGRHVALVSYICGNQ